MKRTIPYYLAILILSQVLINCNKNEVKPFCEDKEIITSKNVSLQLDEASKRSLNNMTSVLNGFNGHSLIFDRYYMVGNVTFELFFDITKSDQYLYLVESRYKDLSKENGSIELFRDPTNKKFLFLKLITKIPINKLDVNNIGKTIVEYNDDSTGKSEFNMVLNFYSLYYSKAFESKTILYKNGKPRKIINCDKDVDFSIILEKKKGEILYDYITTFISSYQIN